MENGVNGLTAHRVVRAARLVPVARLGNLQFLMRMFRHIRLREGFVLDVFEIDEFLGGSYQLYARRKDASKRFYCAPQDIDDDDF